MKHFINSKYILVTIIIAFTFIGCGTKTPPPPPEIVTKIVTSKVPILVKCKVPFPKCDLTGTGYEPTVKLLQCVYDLGHALTKCNNYIDKTVKKYKEKEINQYYKDNNITVN